MSFFKKSLDSVVSRWYIRRVVQKDGIQDGFLKGVFFQKKSFFFKKSLDSVRSRWYTRQVNKVSFFKKSLDSVVSRWYIRQVVQKDGIQDGFFNKVSFFKKSLDSVRSRWYIRQVVQKDGFRTAFLKGVFFQEKSWQCPQPVIHPPGCAERAFSRKVSFSRKVLTASSAGDTFAGLCRRTGFRTAFLKGVFFQEKSWQCPLTSVMLFLVVRHH